MDELHGSPPPPSISQHSAALLTHLTAESTTIIPPTPHTGPTRGGSYGVGTGFDADDAGEEKEDEELYEDVSESWHEVPSKVEDKHTRRSNEGAGRSSTDWRVDSLLRKLLLTADLWVEARGLRSGKARDCHGEVSEQRGRFERSTSLRQGQHPRSAFTPSFGHAWHSSKLCQTCPFRRIRCGLCGPEIASLAPSPTCPISRSRLLPHTPCYRPAEDGVWTSLAPGVRTQCCSVQRQWERPLHGAGVAERVREEEGVL